MQTFLPLADSYAASVSVLDQQRLGKQRVETMQLVTAITGWAFPSEREIAAGRTPGEIFQRGPARGWQRHPAALMWKNDVFALLAYQAATCAEWTSRGYVDTCLEKTALLVAAARPLSRRLRPSWWGDDRVHASHRANLVRKLPERYSRLWPEVEPVDGYFWPSS